MTITRTQIDWMRSNATMRIDADLEEMILAHYGEEPDRPEYTEQYLYEQTRKLVEQYNHEHPHPELADNPTPRAGNRSAAQPATKHRRHKYI